MGNWLTDLITQGGYFGIALLMLLETVFPPIPSEVIMPAAGFYAARGDLSVAGAIFAGTGGAMAGNVFWYLIARWVGLGRMRRWIERYGRWLTMDVEELDGAQAWFDRYGSAAVGFGRIIPTVRSVISIPAGFLQMSLGRFLLFTLVGTTMWTGLLALSGYALGAAYSQIEKYINPVSTGVVVLLVAVYVYRMVTYDRRAKRHRQRPS